MPADPPSGTGRPAPSVDPDLLERPGRGPRGEVWPRFDVLVAVSVGGALGALARFGLTRLVPPDDFGVPWATLSANVAGSLLLGLVTAVAIGRFPNHRYLRPLLGVGVLGSFTTRLGQGRVGPAVAYALVSIAAGIAAAAAGLWLGRALYREQGA